MAYVTGKTGSFDLSMNNSCKVRISWSETYDLELNKSKVAVRAYIRSDSYSGQMFPNGSISVNGEKVIAFSFHSPATHRCNGNIYKNWAEIVGYNSADEPPWESSAISHNTDGSKNIVISVDSFSVYRAASDGYSQNGELSLNLGSAESTVTLTTIPRASSITSVGAITLGNKCNISWTPNSSSFYYKIKFAIGSWSSTTGAISPKTTSSYNYTGFTISLDAAKQLPNATSGTMSATLYTYSDSACSTQLGSSSSKNFTVSVPTSVVPTIGTLTATIDNSANSVVNGWGLAVAGYTKVKVTATASGAYSSTISSFTISGGYSKTVSGTSLSYTGGIITSSGDKTFDVIAKDSRGRSSTQALSSKITFYAYSKPSISSFTVARDDSNPNKMIVKGNWSFSSVNSKNSATGTLYYKKSTESAWTKYGTISKNTSTTLTTNFDQTISYNFRLIVTDALSNSAQEETFVSTVEVLLDFRAGGKGLGIGKIAETDNLEISLDTVFMGDVYIMVGTDKVTLADYIKSITG